MAKSTQASETSKNSPRDGVRGTCSGLTEHDWADALAFDRAHVWHPYSSMTDPLPSLPVVSASGVRLMLSDGRTLIDGMASWWSAIHGYNHPRLNRALETQLGRMAHVMFGGLTHAPAIELARRLVALTPRPWKKCFCAIQGRWRWR